MVIVELSRDQAEIVLKALLREERISGYCSTSAQVADVIDLVVEAVRADKLVVEEKVAGEFQRGSGV